MTTIRIADFFNWTHDLYAAIAEFTKAIEINPNSADSYYFRGISKALINEFNGACQDGRKANSLGYDASDLINYVCN